MSSRKSKWTIHETKRGWDLSKGGRYYYTSLSSQAECVRRLRTYRKAGEPVVLEELDGYLTNITKLLERKGLI